MDRDNIEMAEFWMKEAVKAINSAKRNHSEEDYSTSVNRSYYAMFYAVSAVNILDGRSFKKHSATIASFIHEYVKTGTFPEWMNEAINLAFKARNQGDYMVFYSPTEEDSAKQIRNAEPFVQIIRKYVEGRIDSENGTGSQL